MQYTFSFPQRECDSNRRSVICQTGKRPFSGNFEKIEETDMAVDFHRHCQWTNSSSESAPETKKTDRRSGRRKIKKWWSWWLCSGTPIAPQNPVFLSIPRSSLARYDTSSAAFRLLIYGEKVGKKPFHGEEMGNF